VKYPVRFYLLPPLMFDLIWSIGWASIVAGNTRNVYDALMTFGAAMVIGIPVSLMATAQLFIAIDPEVKLMAYELRSKAVFSEPEPDRIDTLYINTGNSTTRIVGPTKSKWAEWARIIKDNNYACTARAMGNEYQPFKAAIENTRYAENNNGLKLTEDGKRMINRLVERTNNVRNKSIG